MGRRVKVVLDADVIIHFAKGELLHVLPTILPEYEFDCVCCDEGKVYLPHHSIEVPGLLIKFD